MQPEARLYQYRLTKSELLELAFRLTWDTFMLEKIIWLSLAALAILSNVLTYLTMFAGYAASGATTPLPGFRPYHITGLAVFLAVLFVTRVLLRLAMLSRNGYTKEVCWQLENGSIHDLKSGDSYHGSTFSAFIQTPRLLLLRRTISKRAITYMFIPVRLFAGPQEMSDFIDYLRGSAQNTSCQNVDVPSSTQDVPAPFVFTFQLSTDDFAHVYAEVMYILRRHRPVYQVGQMLWIIIFCLLFPLSLAARMLIGGNLPGGISVGIYGILLFLFVIINAAPVDENSYRRLLRQNRFLQNEAGFWSISAFPGVLFLRHDQNSYQRSWDTYTHFYETVDTLFLVRINNKKLEQYVFIPKWAIRCREEQDAFADFCRRRGHNLEFLPLPELENPAAAEKRRKIKNLLLGLAFVLTLVGSTMISLLF